MRGLKKKLGEIVGESLLKALIFLLLQFEETKQEKEKREKEQ